MFSRVIRRVKHGIYIEATTNAAVRVGRRTATRAAAPPQHARQYHKNIVDHYENPRNVGSMNQGDADVGTGLVGAPACGDVMKLHIRVKDGKVVESKFKTFGCGSAIASSSVATEWSKGKTLDECLDLKNADIANHLNLPPVKLHCSMLAEDAIKAAVRDYVSKHRVTPPTLAHT
jgi:Fe-S cluster assembly scaffold IscU